MARGVPGRLLLSAVLVGGVVGAPGLVADAAELSDDPTTTTTVPVTPSTTTPPDPEKPPASTPPTTAPPVVPADPNAERPAMSPEQTLVDKTEFATLTDAQRSLLQKLQTAKDTVALRRFALVALARQVATARERLETARAAEAATRAKLEETRAQLQALKDEIVRLAAAAYRNHKVNWTLGAIGAIDTTNASTLTRAQTYARSDAAHLGVRLDALAVVERRFAADQRAAESARAEAEASAANVDASLVAQTEAYDEAMAATVKAQVALARGLGSESLLAQIVDPRFGADDITAALAYVQAGQGDPATLDPIFAFPVPGARINSMYGIRVDPIGGTVGHHAGLDIEADMYTPIRAAAAGMVVVSGDCGGYGNCVVIDHGTSIATVYAHQSFVMSRPGDLVEAGQVIGLVGSTGRSTGPHLHFEVRLRGTPIDPVPMLSG